MGASNSLWRGAGGPTSDEEEGQDEQKQQHAGRFRRYLQQYVLVLSSAVLGTTMLAMTILSILYVSSNLQRQSFVQIETGV
jgi:hypothetical protein